MSTRRVSLVGLAEKSAPAAPAPAPEKPEGLAPVTAAEETESAVSPLQSVPEPPSDPEPAPRAQKPAPARPRRQAKPERPSEGNGQVPGEWVRYDQLERKEARLRADQYGQLSTVSRELNRARKGAGERITENTLIRVAIDLLLSRSDDLSGTTEAELRKSVGL